ncbi:hypothetical protein [Acinetobacter sp. WCHAc060007]|uniref:hypothetical protein n=1 Tax=Acinetobacter sp. WCHAc060007 TaxID=2419605 RepID=UPI000EA38111|nr:hypothetical protein [Acinetobacter sp. WCHAc060007]RKG40722.1 hypothetical protein D7V31_11540 [Acinetobacter sp. WCHAc060007]
MSIVEKYPYAIKNWRNRDEYLREMPSSGYVKPTKYDLNFWKWEFLRRNGKYQELYASFERYKSDWDEVIIGDLKDFGLYFYINPLRDSGYQSMPALCNIHKLPDFEQNNKYRKEYKNYTDEVALHSVLGQIAEVQQKGGVFISIDLNLPLEIQFQKIKKILNDNRLITISKTISNVRPSEWLTYLRILDAYADGEEVDVISSIIYPEKSNEYPDFVARDVVRKAYKKGKELMDNFAIGGNKVETNGIVSF